LYAIGREPFGGKNDKKESAVVLESIVRNHGGSLHREALAVIFAEKAEARSTVRRKPPVQQAKERKPNRIVNNGYYNY
jgi:hypothetical protein